MNFRTLLVSAGLLAVVCGSVSSQPQQLPGVPAAPPVSPRLDFSPPAPPAGSGVSPFPTIPPPSAGVGVSPVPIPTPPSPQAPPPEKSVEELLNELERVQAQKAELEKKEQELKALIRQRLEKQTERLNKLLPPAKPDRVGQIIIEGNTTTPNQKIIDMLGMTSGDVLRYPALEEARAKLKKAFQDSTVEVIPGSESEFKNIRVRVVEPQVVTPPTLVLPKIP